MRVTRLGWLGTWTERYEETKVFFRDVLGLSVDYEEPDFAVLPLPGGTADVVEVFGPASEDWPRLDAFRLAGPVPGFVVDDVVAARAEMAAAGVELLDEVTWSSSTPGLGWFHFRAPDGGVYALMQGSTALAVD